MPGPRDRFANPWRALMGATATATALGLCAVGVALLLPETSAGLLVVGIALAGSMGGAWAFARSRAASIEPELAALRRDGVVARWEMESHQWAEFARGRRARALAWVLGGAAGLSMLPALLLAILWLGPPEAPVVAGWIAWGLGGLWAVASIGALATRRMGRTPGPVLFTPKLCAVGGAVFSWPLGIATIELDEAKQTLLVTRRGGPWIPARTFAIPVPATSFDTARGLLRP